MYVLPLLFAFEDHDLNNTERSEDIFCYNFRLKSLWTIQPLKLYPYVILSELYTLLHLKEGFELVSVAGYKDSN